MYYYTREPSAVQHSTVYLLYCYSWLCCWVAAVEWHDCVVEESIISGHDVISRMSQIDLAEDVGLWEWALTEQASLAKYSIVLCAEDMSCIAGTGWPILNIQYWYQSQQMTYFTVRYQKGRLLTSLSKRPFCSSTTILHDMEACLNLSKSNQSGILSWSWCGVPCFGWIVQLWDTTVNAVQDAESTVAWRQRTVIFWTVYCTVEWPKSHHSTVQQGLTLEWQLLRNARLQKPQATQRTKKNITAVIWKTKFVFEISNIFF